MKVVVLDFWAMKVSRLMFTLPESLTDAARRLTISFASSILMIII
jgi:hypothetical protein